MRPQLGLPLSEREAAALAALAGSRLTAEQRRSGERSADNRLSLACSWLWREAEAEDFAAEEMSSYSVLEDFAEGGYFTRRARRRAAELEERFGFTPAELEAEVRSRLAERSYRTHCFAESLLSALPREEG